MADEPEDRELMRNRFRRLLGDLVNGTGARNVYQPWEIPIILDFREVRLPGKRRTEILRQYERAVNRQMLYGTGPPMTLSEFLVLRERRRDAAAPRLAVSSESPAAPRSDNPPPAPSG
jgi:hypothetical protein